jgi:hypothetical protein
MYDAIHTSESSTASTHGLVDRNVCSRASNMAARLG